MGKCYGKQRIFQDKTPEAFYVGCGSRHKNFEYKKLGGVLCKIQPFEGLISKYLGNSIIKIMWDSSAARENLGGVSCGFLKGWSNENATIAEKFLPKGVALRHCRGRQKKIQ